MKYSFKSRIRYSETDKNLKLTFPTMLDYFQDTSTFHGEDNNLPLSLLYARKLAWVLTGWQVRLIKPLGLTDIATFSTWAYYFKRNIGLRNYVMSDESGRLCTVAETQYVLMNLEKQLPERIPLDLVSGYSLEPDAHIETGLSRKIVNLKPEEELVPIPVRKYMIDSNNHVNNSQYIKTAMSFLPEDFSFNTFRAEYKRQGRLGDVLYPFKSELDDGLQIKMYDENHELYFIGEWTNDILGDYDAYAR